MFLLANPTAAAAGGTVPPLPAAAMQYYMQVICGGRPAPLGHRDARELKTLAAALDLLSRGSLSHLADLLVQRFKSVEASAAYRDPTPREVAERLELLPGEEQLTAGHAETAMAASLQLKREKLKEKFQKRMAAR